jgi:hypothetical protein
VTWSRPALPDSRSCGAWQNWRYKIVIGDAGHPEISDAESFSFQPEPVSI